MSVRAMKAGAVEFLTKPFRERHLLRAIEQAIERVFPPGADFPVVIHRDYAQSFPPLLMLRRLREMGVRIAVDDFGTGHSSLNYLRHFPIDCVKIDQGFVHEIETSAADRAIVSAVIRMAHGLSLRVTAEGVETEEQLAYLREQGCEEAQGYLFGRPKPAAEFGGS